MQIKIFSLIAAFIFLFLIQTTYAQFGGGDGTAESPYEIWINAHFIELADSVNNGNNWSQEKYFQLMDYITDSIRIVIGNCNEPFQGHFEGNEKK